MITITPRLKLQPQIFNTNRHIYKLSCIIFIQELDMCPLYIDLHKKKVVCDATNEKYMAYM